MTLLSLLSLLAMHMSTFMYTPHELNSSSEGFSVEKDVFHSSFLPYTSTASTLLPIGMYTVVDSCRSSVVVTGSKVTSSASCSDKSPVKTFTA